MTERRFAILFTLAIVIGFTVVVVIGRSVTAERAAEMRECMQRWPGLASHHYAAMSDADVRRHCRRMNLTEAPSMYAGGQHE